MKKSVGKGPHAMPTPVWLVGTYDITGKANLATVAWGGVCCSDPASVTISLRKSRHSYDAILKRGAFTVNIPSQQFVVAADYAGIASGKNEDKFAQAGLTAVKSDLVDAPYVGEFPLVIECRLLQTVEVGVHTQFIGEIVDVKADESVLDAKGLPDPAKVQPLVYSPTNRAYYALGEVVGQGFDIGKQLMK
ncbi:flavin reductase family protein [Geomonas anaerohicana]|uniref:Flavin reductase family protein n=1 Tax=Geomonas anaerohicana TaxID=2798583 RepID=A0ABS0YDI9_9BACT|nr:flavin reductase family protein [Geomonas anaerohicana]MBJ6750355.1 flavin reductase family protein [Geomonas anaerohicana]